MLHLPQRRQHALFTNSHGRTKFDKQYSLLARALLSETTREEILPCDFESNASLCNTIQGHTVVPRMTRKLQVLVATCSLIKFAGITVLNNSMLC